MSSDVSPVVSGLPSTASPILPNPAPTRRLASIDAYRGLVMFLMMAEVLRFCAGGQRGAREAHLGIPLPSPVARGMGRLLAPRHDPAVVLVPGRRGVAVLAGRPAGAGTIARQDDGACASGDRWYWSSSGSSSGLDRPPPDQFHVRGHPSARSAWATRSCSCWLFARCASSGSRWSLILVGYWAAFALYPLPGPDFDYPAVGVPADWPHLMSGFAGALGQEQQPGLGVRHLVPEPVPAAEPFRDNGGGYATLSFIPTLATMILGLIAGGILKRERPGLVQVPLASAWREPSAWRWAGAWASWASARW